MIAEDECSTTHPASVPGKRELKYRDDPRVQRPGEKIGGKYLVFRRSKIGRVRTPEYPFEHPTLKSAEDELEQLRQQHPEDVWCIFMEVQRTLGVPVTTDD